MKQFFRWLAPSVLLMAMVMGQPALATDPAPAKKDDGHGAPAKDDHGAKKDDHGAKKDDGHGARPRTRMAAVKKRLSAPSAPLKAKNRCFISIPNAALTLSPFTKPMKRNISSAVV